MLPEGVTGAKPMPKAGWTIATVEGKLNAHYFKVSQVCEKGHAFHPYPQRTMLAELRLDW